MINCKIHLELNWTKTCVTSVKGDDQYVPEITGTTFKITNTKLYVPIVFLSTKDNVKLTKQLNEGFERPVYWNEYKSEIESRILNDQIPKRFHLEASFEGVKKLLVLAFNNATVNVANNPTNNTNNRAERNSYRKYFLTRVNTTNYNVLIDGIFFYDQPINDQIKKYDEIRKIATGQGDDCTTRCLLDYQYFRDYYQLIAVDLSKQKQLDAD